jgi:uncharacterized protein YaeQ
MSQGSILRKFVLELADADRGVYESLELRLAQHKSESDDYLVTRMLAWCLCWEPELEIAPELCQAEEPALSVRDTHGRIRLWVEIGLPTAERIHKASKAADRVLVFPHRSPQALEKNWAGMRIHKAEAIEVVVPEPELVARLAGALDRGNRWHVTVSDGELIVDTGRGTVHGPIRRFRPLESGD